MCARPRRRKGRLLLASGIILTGLLILGLTITPRPTSALANEIDRLVEQDPCVGSVQNWDSRHYAWSAASWRNDWYLLWFLTAPWLGSDTSKVNIRFYQGPGAAHYPPGRHLLRADQDNFGLDDSNMLVVFGTYDVGARRMTHWVCGSNVN